MCGIAGIWKFNNKALSFDTLKKFTDSMSHRGPDGSGYELLNNSFGLGHRRLSILDLSDAGRQPMYNITKDLLISFNGEIYNFIEVRKELMNSGERFFTETDTEVILSAYRRWGKDCLNKFNGMFAIAIYDIEKKELFIARDRFGVKPLYYLYQPENIFAFASETIAFKNLDDFTREVNKKTIGIGLTQPEVLEGSDRTIFSGIYQLLPGHFLTITPEEFYVKQWWNTADNLVAVPSSYDEQVARFISIFEDACRLRLRSDVTIASALSGGLDSSSVYCTLHKMKRSNENTERQAKNWQKAFVATFPGTSVDEKMYAKQVVNHVNGDVVYIEPSYKYLVNDVVKATKLFDSVTQTPITSITDVYRAMRKSGVIVSLDGHGVDEMMYGYNSYVMEAFYDCIKQKQFGKAREYAEIIAGLSPTYKIQDLLNTINQNDRSLIRRGISYIKRKTSPQKDLTKKTSDRAVFWSAEFDVDEYNEIISGFKIPSGMSGAEAMMYADFHYKSLPINLRDFDRASMQQGVEIRMPFMDYRLVTYVFSLPVSSKLGGGFTKRILRDAMKGVLPEPIRARTLKIGIGAPMVEWFANELKEFVMDEMSSAGFTNSPYWNGPEIKNTMDKLYKENKLDKVVCNKAWSYVSANIVLNG